MTQVDRGQSSRSLTPSVLEFLQHWFTPEAWPHLPEVGTWTYNGGILVSRHAAGVGIESLSKEAKTRQGPRQWHPTKNIPAGSMAMPP